MWLDNKNIPESELQAYVDLQRQEARGIGCEVMTKKLTPLILKATQEAEEYKQQISNLKRQVTRLKNKMHGTSPIRLSVLATTRPELFRTKFIEFLMDELSSPYCNNCRGNEPDAAADFCEECHRKSMGWQLSRVTAEAIADEAIKLFMPEKPIESAEVITAEELLRVLQKHTQIVAPRAGGKRLTLGFLDLLQRIAQAEHLLGDTSAIQPDESREK